VNLTKDYELEVVTCTGENEFIAHQDMRPEYLKRFYRMVHLQADQETCPNRVCVLYQNVNNPLDIVGFWYKKSVKSTKKQEF